MIAFSRYNYSTMCRSDGLASDARASRHEPIATQVVWASSYSKLVVGDDGLRSAPWSHSANRCQSNSVETSNPFASSEQSVQATIIADGMTIRLILEAARLDMHLIRLGSCRFNAKSGSHRRFLASPQSTRSATSSPMGSLSLYGLVALLLHLLVTLFKYHRHRRETHRRRKILLSFIHRLSHNEEEKKRRISQVIYPYQHGNLGFLDKITQLCLSFPLPRMHIEVTN